MHGNVRISEMGHRVLQNEKLAQALALAIVNNRDKLADGESFSIDLAPYGKKAEKLVVQQVSTQPADTHTPPGQS